MTVTPASVSRRILEEKVPRGFSMGKLSVILAEELKMMNGGVA
jgi:hypothetical protein